MPKCQAFIIKLNKTNEDLVGKTDNNLRILWRGYLAVLPTLPKMRVSQGFWWAMPTLPLPL